MLCRGEGDELRGDCSPWPRTSGGGLCYINRMILGTNMNTRRALGLLVVILASLLGLLLLPPIAQNQNCHDFADQRTLLGIPNFWNVVQTFLSSASVP